MIPLHWERIMGRLIAILLLFVFSLVWCLPADTAKAQDSLSGMRASIEADKKEEKKKSRIHVRIYGAMIRAKTVVF